MAPPVGGDAMPAPAVLGANDERPSGFAVSAYVVRRFIRGNRFRFTTAKAAGSTLTRPVGRRSSLQRR